MKTLIASFSFLVSLGAAAQECTPAAEIGKQIRENTTNENTYYCKSLKGGDKKHLGGDVNPLQGVIISVSPDKQQATWSSLPQKGARGPEIRTLPCSYFLSEPEKLALTASDPNIPEGRSKLAKMLANPCRRTADGQ
jgi:hypothetical protein